jgi:hypothetical protein
MIAPIVHSISDSPTLCVFENTTPGELKIPVPGTTNQLEFRDLETLDLPIMRLKIKQTVE